MLGLFQRAPSTFHIQSGKFDKDYFNIQKKPRIGSILVDNTSAAITINKENEKQVLLPGFHFLKNGEQVLHLINFNSHHFYWELIDQDLSHTISNSRIEHGRNHSRSMNPSQPSTKTKDGLSAIPTFSIHYNFSCEQTPDEIKEFLMELSNYFSAKNVHGELDTHLKNLIYSSISSIWQILLAQTNAADLCSLSDTKISLAEEFIRKINTFLNSKTKEDIFKLPNGQNAKFPESIYFVKRLRLLNMRVYLESLWIENNNLIV